MRPSIGTWGSFARGELDVAVDKLHAELPPLIRGEPYSSRVLVRPQRLAQVGQKRVELSVSGGGGMAFGSRRRLFHWALCPRTRCRARARGRGGRYRRRVAPQPGDEHERLGVREELASA